MSTGGPTVQWSVPVVPDGCVLFAAIADAPTGCGGAQRLVGDGRDGIGPTVFGHIGFTYVVRFIPAYIVGAVILLEPVGATALGVVVLDEWPSVIEIVGAAIIVLALIMATLEPKSHQANTASQSG